MGTHLRHSDLSLSDVGIAASDVDQIGRLARGRAHDLLHLREVSSRIGTGSSHGERRLATPRMTHRETDERLSPFYWLVGSGRFTDADNGLIGICPLYWVLRKRTNHSD